MRTIVEAPMTLFDKPAHGRFQIGLDRPATPQRPLPFLPPVTPSGAPDGTRQGRLLAGGLSPNRLAPSPTVWASSPPVTRPATAQPPRPPVPAVRPAVSQPAVGQARPSARMEPPASKSAMVMPTAAAAGF